MRHRFEWTQLIESIWIRYNENNSNVFMTVSIHKFECVLATTTHIFSFSLQPAQFHIGKTLRCLFVFLYPMYLRVRSLFTTLRSFLTFEVNNDKCQSEVKSEHMHRWMFPEYFLKPPDFVRQFELFDYVGTIQFRIICPHHLRTMPPIAL